MAPMLTLILLAGPSPRGRGNPQAKEGSTDAQGAIPAWAGKPRSRSVIHRKAAGHPRVGGETPMQYKRIIASEGPSPRGRGNRSRRRL